MIITKRCIITKFEKEHADFYYNLVTDVKVRKYLGGVPSEKHIEESINNFITNSVNMIWVVKEKKSEELIGFIAIDKSEQFQQDEISYEFLPNCWGQGYAIETISEVLEYAFKTENKHELIAITQSKNKRSRNLLEKLGLRIKMTEIMFNEEQSIYQISKDQFLMSCENRHA
ncbi:GNAT family N-acetyltransferase [Fusibacter bizertensis]|uniref:GNAT family N-acetyltransferase n=1 Tax=Fusibacter bizertensis TaxID=1488331 RepID=A0ABT6NFR4_9FIRM|nr:GNAT family N-acetyltransferase [Fusibacter bizertensis]MDH8679279.1 GNAT family N-acetyltransferase [Fusibacter bizertensis]